MRKYVIILEHLERNFVSRHNYLDLGDLDYPENGVKSNCILGIILIKFICENYYVILHK